MVILVIMHFMVNDGLVPVIILLLLLLYYQLWTIMEKRGERHGQPAPGTLDCCSQPDHKTRSSRLIECIGRLGQLYYAV